MLGIAISLHTLCSNRGIISFPMVKLTIPGGHDLVLAPKTDLTRRILCPGGSVLWLRASLKFAAARGPMGAFGGHERSGGAIGPPGKVRISYVKLRIRVF